MRRLALDELPIIAQNVREHILRMSTDGGCFTGASLSCTDLIVYLYTRFLNVSIDNLFDPDRDYFFLSKGHDVPALYGTLAELGFIARARLSNHLSSHDTMYWHPNRNIPGIEFHSGSLGHLISVAAGVALDCKLHSSPSRIVVALGDGELNEGSVWEACLVAQAYRLDNLILLVDRNAFQANVRTESLIPLEPLEDKFSAFNFSVTSIDGHDFEAMEETFARIPMADGKPTAIIAHTVRGKGVPSIEARADRWFCNFSHDEVQQLINELHTNQSAELTSDTLLVR